MISLLLWEIADGASFSCYNFTGICRKFTDNDSQQCCFPGTINAHDGRAFRAKTFDYVASVTAAYRKALDAYLADPANDNFELPAEVYEELTRTSHRHYSPGFYFGREQARQATDSATYIREWEFVGTVEGWENGVASCQQRGKWSLGDTLEALCPDGRSIPLSPEWIENEAGERVESTPHAMEKYTIPTPELPPMSLLRRKTV